jgi:signal transduction histidine kinase
MASWFRRYRPEQLLFLGFLVLALALLTVDFFRNPVHGFTGYRWIMTGLLVVTLGLTAWTLLGGLKGPAAIFLAMAFAAFTYVAVSFNGAHSVTVTMFILLIVVAVPLLGWGAALFTTVASLAVLWVLAFLPIPIALPEATVQARNLSMVFGGVFLLVWWYSRQLREGAARLRQSNVELEARVDERTKQVLVSEKLATVGRLSAGLAHELNTPLGAVSSSHASAEAALRAGLVSAFRNLSPGNSERRALLEALVDRILNAEPPTHLPSSTESRERRKQLRQWGDEGELPFEVRTALVDVLADLPRLERSEFLALGRDPGWKVSLSLLESVHTLVRSLDVIGRGTRRMEQVVRSFQTLSRGETDSPAVSLDPREELEGSLVLLKSRIPTSIEIVRSFEPVRVLCRPDRLGRVLVNLVTNALQAMDYQGTLELSVAREKDFALLCVADSGPGVPEPLRERIFEPFFTTKPPGEGNGLGLSLSRQICEEEGGSLRLEPRTGRTVFAVRLPLAGA